MLLNSNSLLQKVFTFNKLISGKKVGILWGCKALRFVGVPFQSVGRFSIGNDLASSRLLHSLDFSI